MVEEKTCNEMMKRVEGDVKTNKDRLNNHSGRIDFIEQEIIGMKKDTSRLEMIMDKLEIAIENLNKTILEMKYKPMKFYEQVIMGIVMLIIGFLFAKLTK